MRTPNKHKIFIVAKSPQVITVPKIVVVNREVTVVKPKRLSHLTQYRVETRGKACTARLTIERDMLYVTNVKDQVLI